MDEEEKDPHYIPTEKSQKDNVEMISGQSYLLLKN